MGFVPTTLTLAVSAAVATSASSLKFSGVRYKSFGLTVKSLSEEGWITTYQRPYSHPTTSADLDRACAPEDQVIVAAMDTSFNLIVAACGECSSVMSQTKDRWEEHKHNGVSWYRYGPEGSFGFHGSTDGDKELASADLSESRCESRLSWHLDQQLGGYRAGCTEGLQSSAAYWKVILKLPAGGGWGEAIVGNTCYGAEESTACGPRILVTDCLREDKLGRDARRICPAMCNSCISTTSTATTATTTTTGTTTTYTATEAFNSLAIENNPDIVSWALAGFFAVLAFVMATLWCRAKNSAKENMRRALSHTFISETNATAANDPLASPYSGYIDQHPDALGARHAPGRDVTYRDIAPTNDAANRSYEGSLANTSYTASTHSARSSVASVESYSALTGAAARHEQDAVVQQTHA